jgi:hypothetical protein
MANLGNISAQGDDVSAEFGTCHNVLFVQCQTAQRKHSEVEGGC